MKKKFKILDVMFAHAKYSTDYQDSKFIEWNRLPIVSTDANVFYTDYSLEQVSSFNDKKYAWLLESPVITSYAYQWIEKNNNKFDFVLTHKKELLDRGENFIFCPTGGCWIKPEDQQIYDKSKLVSIIASAKRFTQGHMLRHQSIHDFMDKMDVYGRGYNPVDYKLDALKDYAFSVTIENTNKDFYFTEKLIDCFMTGTVPIYWGCPSIGDFFNTEGMILFNDISELKEIFNGISFSQYIGMKNAIEENFEKAKEFLIAEDYIYKNYLEKNE